MTAATQIIEILARHHATVANKHDALEPEALLQINHDVGDRHGIAPIAGEYMMRDRPTVDHDQTHEHLRAIPEEILDAARHRQMVVDRLFEDLPTLVGIDHGFSFPLRYFETHDLKHDWPAFLDDFQRHCPTRITPTLISSARVAEVIVRGRAMVKRPEPTQKLDLLLAEPRNVDEALRAGQNRKQA